MTLRQNKRGLPVRPKSLMLDGEDILRAIGDPQSPGRIAPEALTAQERRAGVAVLYASGWGQAAIASRFRVAASVIYNDIREIRKQAGTETTRITVQELSGHFMTRLDHLYRKTMEIFEQTSGEDGGPDDNVKLRALQQAAAIEKQRMDVLMKLGIKAPDTDDMQIRTMLRERLLIVAQRMVAIVDGYIPEQDRPQLGQKWKELLDEVEVEVVGDGG